MKWDLKSIVTLTFVVVLAVAFLSVIICALVGVIDPTAALVTTVTSAFVSSESAVIAFYFSKKKDDKKDGEI